MKLHSLHFKHDPKLVSWFIWNRFCTRDHPGPDSWII